MIFTIHVVDSKPLVGRHSLHWVGAEQHKLPMETIYPAMIHLLFQQLPKKNTLFNYPITLKQSLMDIELP